MAEEIKIALTQPDRTLAIGAERKKENVIEVSVTNISGGKRLLEVELHCNVGQTAKALLNTANDGVDAKLVSVATEVLNKPLEREDPGQQEDGVIWFTAAEGTELSDQGELRIALQDFAVNTPVGQATLEVKVYSVEKDEGDKYELKSVGSQILGIEKIADTDAEPKIHYLVADDDYVLHGGADPVTLSFFTSGTKEPVLYRNNKPVERNVDPSGETREGVWVAVGDSPGQREVSEGSDDDQTTIFGQLVDRPSITTIYRLDVSRPEEHKADRIAPAALTVQVAASGWNRISHPFGYPTQMFLCDDLTGSGSQRIYGIFLDAAGAAHLFSSATGLDDWRVESGSVPSHMAESPGATFDGKLWLVGGSTVYQDKVCNDLYAYEKKGNRFDWVPKSLFDGDPKQKKTVSFRKRMGHAVTVLTRDGKAEMWIIGGYDNGSYFSDVQRIRRSGPDGAENNYMLDTLKPSADKPWSPRFRHAATVLKGAGKDGQDEVCIYGGIAETGSCADFWASTDGATWYSAAGIRPSPGYAKGATLVAAPQADGRDRLILAGTFTSLEGNEPNLLRSHLYERFEREDFWCVRNVGEGWEIFEGTEFHMQSLAFGGFLYFWSLGPDASVTRALKPKLNVFIPA